MAKRKTPARSSRSAVAHAKSRSRALVPAEGHADLPAAPTRRAGYMRDGRGPTMVGWRPALREPYQDVQLAWRDAAARTTDLSQNVGWVAGAMMQMVANVVGRGLWLCAQPSADALRLDDDRTSEWASDTEKKFRAHCRRAYSCDLEGRRKFGQAQAAAFLHWFVLGEYVAQFPWRRRPGVRLGTKFALVPAFRMSQRSEPMTHLVHGVRMDADGLPVSHLFDLPDPYVGKREVEVEDRDGLGRQKLLHVFDGALGHVRGISPMVPVLAVARQYDQLANATLMQAIVQAAFAISFESDRPTDEAIKALLTPKEISRMESEGMTPFDMWFDAQANWYDQKTIDVGIAGRTIHTAPGDKMNFHTSETPGPQYKDYARDLRAEMARCAGATYAGFTGDSAGATYSSLKFDSDENHRITLYRREHIVAPFCQAFYENWLEEAIEVGEVQLPGGMAQFRQNRDGIANADWKGTPKPVADELKLAQAQVLWRKLRVKSRTMIADENGDDYEDVCADDARDAKTRARFGLADPEEPDAATTASSMTPAKEETSPSRAAA